MNNNYIEQKKNTHLYFQIGKNKYAVNSENVLEIMKLPALDYPQKLPNNIIGLLKYNNFVINIVDIRFYLDIEVTPYNSHNELIIVKTDEVIFGIITDRVIGILPFNSALVDQIPFVDNKMIIESLYKFNNETIFIVNLYALENLLKRHDIEISDIDILSLFPQDSASKYLMTQRTHLIAEKSALRLASGELHAKNKYISFNLNKDYYCIALDYVKEVLKDTLITQVPGTPNFIEGIMNLRGDYITVINLKKFLSLPDEVISEKKPVIIVKCNELKLALLIDKINELFEYQETLQEETSESYYAKEFIYNKTLYTVLNIDRISSDKKIIITDM
ncbi:chemotaxis protein CheW [bacterium]|nr:chemotaxis protein CheW [bacterium]